MFIPLNMAIRRKLKPIRQKNITFGRVLEHIGRTKRINKAKLIDGYINSSRTVVSKSFDFNRTARIWALSASKAIRD